MKKNLSHVFPHFALTFFQNMTMIVHFSKTFNNLKIHKISPLQIEKKKRVILQNTIWEISHLSIALM